MRSVFEEARDLARACEELPLKSGSSVECSWYLAQCRELASAASLRESLGEKTLGYAAQQALTLALIVLEHTDAPAELVAALSVLASFDEDIAKSGLIA